MDGSGRAGKSLASGSSKMEIKKNVQDAIRIAKRWIGVPSDEISEVIQDLFQGQYFLQHVQKPVDRVHLLIKEISAFEKRLSLPEANCIHAISCLLRQSILMSLLPASAFDTSYSGSIDRAIKDHLDNLEITVEASLIVRLRDICININKLRNLTSSQARSQSKSLSDIRAQPAIYASIMSRQNSRCVWCGVQLSSGDVKMSLEHMAPKHIGDDMPDTSNWAIACTTCNSGKGETLSWSTSPFATGYLRAKHFVDPSFICGETRWAILARDTECDTCKQNPTDVELGIYRKISTGLPIPQFCAATCANCALAEGKEILSVKWDNLESTRSFP